VLPGTASTKSNYNNLLAYNGASNAPATLGNLFLSVKRNGMGVSANQLLIYAPVSGTLGNFTSYTTGSGPTPSDRVLSTYFGSSPFNINQYGFIYLSNTTSISSGANNVAFYHFTADARLGVYN
jgi:hypothetical protein